MVAVKADGAGEGSGVGFSVVGDVMGIGAGGAVMQPASRIMSRKQMPGVQENLIGGTVIPASYSFPLGNIFTGQPLSRKLQKGEKERR
jgi:hypothetical protein